MPKRKAQHEGPARQDTRRSKQTKLSLNSKLAKKDDDSAPSSVQSFKFISKDKEIPCEQRGKDGKPALIFTHGAGGGLSNAATREFAEGFSEKCPVVSFQGNMNLQGRVQSFEAVLEHEDVQCAIGGRSMGT